MKKLRGPECTGWAASGVGGGLFILIKPKHYLHVASSFTIYHSWVYTRRVGQPPGNINITPIKSKH